MHVALHAAKLSARLFRPAHAVGFVGKVKQQAPDRDQALAYLGGKVTFFADRLQNLIVAPGPVATADFRLEIVVRVLIDLRTDALQNAGRAIDHRIQQVHQYRFAGHRRRASARELVADDHERARLIVAYRDEAMARQNEGHRRGLWRGGVGLAHQRRGHVTRAVFGAEAAGALDLLHFFAGGNRRAGCTLDELVLLVVGIDEVEPDRILRYGDIRRDRHAVERCAARNVDPQHDPSADAGAYRTREASAPRLKPLMGQ